MEAHFESQNVPFTAGGALSARQLVKLSADDTVIATTANTDRAIGAVANDSADKLTGDTVSIRLFSTSGTISVIASVATTYGTTLYPAADGKTGVASASTSVPIGMAKNGAAADTDLFEMIPVGNGNLIA